LGPHVVSQSLDLYFLSPISFFQQEERVQEEQRMTIKVRIPTPLQKLTNGNAEVECSVKNVTELIDALERDYPGMQERLSESGKIRRFINIYVNDEDIRFLNKEDTVLKDGDTISIVPAIAGG
jgi:molybdopterin synthase sulfur carrier subunit